MFLHLIKSASQGECDRWERPQGGIFQGSSQIPGSVLSETFRPESQPNMDGGRENAKMTLCLTVGKLE